MRLVNMSFKVVLGLVAASMFLACNGQGTLDTGAEPMRLRDIDGRMHTFQDRRGLRVEVEYYPMVDEVLLTIDGTDFAFDASEISRLPREGESILLDGRDTNQPVSVRIHKTRRVRGNGYPFGCTDEFGVTDQNCVNARLRANQPPRLIVTFLDHGRTVGTARIQEN